MQLPSNSEEPQAKEPMEPSPSPSSSSVHRSGMFIRVLAIILVVGVLLGALFAFLASRHTQSTVTHHPTPARGWAAIPSPNPGKMKNGLNAVATLSANNIWAVGEFSDSSDPNSGQTLIEHWNGSQWSVVPSPNTQHTLNVLSGVAAASPNDIWAVGYATDSGPNPNFSPFLVDTHTLIEHWNGSQWSIVPSPNPGMPVALLPGVVTTLNVLNGVAAVSPNNVWAVGYSVINMTNNQASSQQVLLLDALIEHWDGRHWSVVKSPATGFFTNTLNGVMAISANNIWAVGFSFGTPNGFTQDPLIEHWDGSRWSIVQNPDTGSPYNSLTSIAAVSPTDIWAVGWSNQFGISSHAAQTLIEHWDGSRWTIVQSPNDAFANNNQLFQVVAVSNTDVWAVGAAPRSYPEQGTALIEHWDGSQWSIVQGQNPGRNGSNFLTGVTLVPNSNQLWAVGYYGSGDPEHTITEVWNP
jgi:hypothetical protein